MNIYIGCGSVSMWYWVMKWILINRGGKEWGKKEIEIKKRGKILYRGRSIVF